MDELVGKKLSSRQCFIHFKGKSGEICKLTSHTIIKINEYCEKWLSLDGEQSQIAANVAEKVKRWSLDTEGELREEIENVEYHKECYIRFCDKTKIERSEKRVKKIALNQGEASTFVPEPTDDDRSVLETVARVSPRTQLKSGKEKVPRRNKHILPEQCIICKKRDSYISEKVTLLMYISIFLT